MDRNALRAAVATVGLNPGYNNGNACRYRFDSRKRADFTSEEVRNVFVDNLPVTKTLSRVSLRSALFTILKPFGLIAVARDGAIWIMAPDGTTLNDLER